MGFLRYANADVIEVRTSKTRVAGYAGYNKLAEMAFKDYQTSDGFVYARVRAIASKTNRNHDSWPATELKQAYRTFIGKPIFVDHHNHDPDRARGVVVDAELHEETDKTASFDAYYSSADVDPLHLPPTWIELLLEVDAQRFPRLAKAIISKQIDAVSMGADVGYTLCNICNHRAEDPSQFCRHIISKGAYFDAKDARGHKISKKAAEHCFKVAFFEISWVFDPAEESALMLDVKHSAFAPDLRQMVARTSIFDEEMPIDPDLPEPPMDPQAGLATEAPNRENEPERVKEWRYQQLLKMGYPPELADQISDQEYRGPGKGIDIHELEKMIGTGATPEQAYGIVSKRLAAAKLAQNPVPQSEMNRMPEHVDTLRQEDVCPVCGSDMEDGECTLCGFTEPPEGFNNPDLEKAREVDTQIRGDQNPDEEPMDPQNQVEPGAVGGNTPPTDPSQMMSHYYAATSNPDGTINIRSRTAAQQPVQRIRTQERPLLPVTRRNSDKPLAVKTLRNPTKPIESHIINTKESMPNQKTADGAKADGGADVQADNRVDVEGVGAVSGDPLSGIDHENVEKDTGDFTAPHTKTWGAGDGDSLGQQTPVTSETFEGGGQGSGNAVGVSAPPPHSSAFVFSCDNKGCTEDDPCEFCKHKKQSFMIAANKYIKERDGKWVIIQKGTGKVLSTHDSQDKAEASFRAMEMHKHEGAQRTADGPEGLGGPIGELATGGPVGQGVRAESPSAPGFPDSTPSRVDLAAGLLEETAPRTMTWSDGKGDSLGQQAPVTGESGIAGSGPIGVPAPTTALSGFGFAVKAMKLAETEERMGIVQSRWQRIAELERKSEEYIDAQLEMLTRVKTASSQRTTARTARRMPSMRPTAAFDVVTHSSETISVEDSLIW